MLYEELLAQAKRDPDSGDFADLRKSYLQSDSYQPYFRDDEKINKNLSSVIEKKEWDLALKNIDNLLEINYLDIKAHIRAYEIWTEICIQEKAEYHTKFAEKLLPLIYQSGDGRSCKTAFVVTAVQEEYIICDLYGVKIFSQSLAVHNDCEYDVLTCLNPKTGGQGKIYFNIDIPKRWLHNHIQLPDELNF
jgi:hypothetical protein